MTKFRWKHKSHSLLLSPLGLGTWGRCFLNIAQTQLCRALPSCTSSSQTLQRTAHCICSISHPQLICNPGDANFAACRCRVWLPEGLISNPEPLTGRCSRAIASLISRPALVRPAICTDIKSRMRSGKYWYHCREPGAAWVVSEQKLFLQLSLQLHNAS